MPTCTVLGKHLSISRAGHHPLGFLNLCLTPAFTLAPSYQALYEAVRADRNLYSKTLIEAQDEISELKRKFKIQGHQASDGRMRAPTQLMLPVAGCGADLWQQMWWLRQWPLSVCGSWHVAARGRGPTKCRSG